ncbi:MAG: class I SAM-dependent methyltransferase [Gammaproteobacteria bacterium]|nr:class I SAM-dependent methyltransferase [Gammaproteobacteria bacterium]
MNDNEFRCRPRSLVAIQADAERIGFGMGSEAKTGAFLAALAASKPGGRFLELGTGVGHGTAWILEGADPASRLDTVDSDGNAVAIARRHLGTDPRVTFHVMDGAEFIKGLKSTNYDFIYADTWPGKFTHLDETLSLLRLGEIYVVDDLLPQSNWPDGHSLRVPLLLDAIESRQGFASVKLAWASGLLLVVRNAAQQCNRPDSG